MNKPYGWILTATATAIILSVTSFLYPTGPIQQDDPSLFLAPDGRILVLAPHGKRTVMYWFNPGTMTTSQVHNVPLLCVGGQPYDDGYLLEARTDTPDGRATIQPFLVTAGGPPTALFPNSETMRQSFVKVSNGYAFEFSDEYKGAFAGQPWGNASIRLLGTDGRVTELVRSTRQGQFYDISGSGFLLPYPAAEGPSSSRLLLVNTASHSVRLLATLPIVGGACISPDQNSVVCLVKPMAFDQTAIATDIASGKRLWSAPVHGRVIKFGYDPQGDLLFFTFQVGSNAIFVSKLVNGSFIPSYSIPIEQ